METASGVDAKLLHDHVFILDCYISAPRVLMLDWYRYNGGDTFLFLDLCLLFVDATSVVLLPLIHVVRS